MNQNNKIFITLTIYITSLFASNTLGLKLMPFIFHSNLSVGVFCFPIVFITTDVIGELYGKEMAKTFVWCGFASILIFITYSLLSLNMPWASGGLWVKDSYNTIFGISTRISIASLVAYIVGEYQDVFTFFFFKKFWGGRFFLIRSNLSNLWSQLVDTVLFMSIAFLGVYSIRTLIISSLTWWAYKVIMGFLYSPLSLLALKILKNEKLNIPSN